jgi:predicted metal-binding membrane protein
MAGMDAGPWTDPGALGFYISTWVVMMAAMMLPSLAPVVLRYSDHQHGPMPHARISHAGKTGLFVAGYLAVWAAVGLVGYALLEAGRSLDGGVFSWDRAGRWTAAGVLLAATGYQFTPAKRACLTRCRNARASRYGTSHDHRASRDGGLRSGIRHGLWCLGCCWALMVALFALGAMSVAWMVLISVLIAGERLLPWRTLGAIGVAAVLAALTIGVAAAPSRVPLLRIPHASMSMQAMGSK